jgi:hypothetical protein
MTWPRWLFNKSVYLPCHFCYTPPLLHQQLLTPGKAIAMKMPKAKAKAKVMEKAKMEMETKTRTRTRTAKTNSVMNDADGQEMRGNLPLLNLMYTTLHIHSKR